MSFAEGLVTDGLWQSYFRTGIRSPVSGQGSRIASHKIGQLVIRKGFKAEARRVFAEKNNITVKNVAAFLEKMLTLWNNSAGSGISVQGPRPILEHRGENTW